MQEIQVFKNELFGEVRVAGTSEEPLFCLADVCRVLEIQSGATKNRLDEKGISLINTPTNGGVQALIYINEKNLYKVIMRSDKPQAEPFQDWVCGDVLPTIRKTGQYSLVLLSYQISDPIKRAEKWIEEEKVRQQLALENEMNRPKVVYFDNLVSRNLLTNLRDTAKQIHIPQNKFISLLINNKYLYRDAKEKLKPYSQYVPMYFELKDYERNVHAGTQLLVTPRGKEVFRLLWSE